MAIPYTMPDPAHWSPACGRPTLKAASTFFIGRSGRNDGLQAAHLAQPNYQSIGHSSSSPMKTSSGPNAKRSPRAPKMRKLELRLRAKRSDLQPIAHSQGDCFAAALLAMKYIFLHSLAMRAKPDSRFFCFGPSWRPLPQTALPGGRVAGFALGHRAGYALQDRSTTRIPHAWTSHSPAPHRSAAPTRPVPWSSRRA